MARFTRSSFVDILQEDYVRTARAKGLTEPTVVVKHGLRNALIPVVTMMGLQFGFLLGGSIVVEVVFNWPGMGRLLVDAVDMRDYPVIQALVLLFSLEFILINLIVDVLYAADQSDDPLPLMDDAAIDAAAPVAGTERGAHAVDGVLAQVQAAARRARRRRLRAAAGRRRRSSRRGSCPYDAENFFDYDRLNAPPSLQHWFGVDPLGPRHLQPHPDGRAHLAHRRLRLGRGRRA